MRGYYLHDLIEINSQVYYVTYNKNTIINNLV